MGLKLRLNLFEGVWPDAVFDAYAAFYAAQERRLIAHGDDFWRFDLHERDGRWTTLWLDGGWEWEVRRAAQLDVSRRLGCAGLLVFVYDGDYWGYELFANGVVYDHFIQDVCSETDHWFPEASIVGDAEQLASHLHLDPRAVAAYLVHDPFMSFEAERASGDRLALLSEESHRLDVPARPGDQFTRFDECAVLDFLRFLGVRVELRDQCVRLLAPVWRTFWIEGQNRFR